MEYYFDVSKILGSQERCAKIVGVGKT